MLNKERLMNSFIELVKIDSETGYEREISEHLKQQLSALGCQVVEDDAGTKTGHEAGNLIADLSPSQGMENQPCLLFTCHMDTVTPGKGIQPRLDDDGYFRGDGSTILGSDDKAGLAAILEAVKVIRENDIPHGLLQIVITTGEESGLVGSREIDLTKLKADFGYALDSNGPVGDLIVAAPAQAKMDVKVYGKAAHAGVNPEDGISAIQVASKAISQMPLGRIDADTTANIGSFAGGKQTNIVCDYVQIQAEARSLVKEKLESQIAIMHQAFKSAAAKYHTSIQFESQIVYPGYRLNANEQVVQIASHASRRIGRKPRLLTSGGGSDANHFNAYGIPTVNLGIGYEEIHSTRERLPLEELIKTAEIIIGIVQEAYTS